jgi:hypothetical protein
MIHDTSDPAQPPDPPAQTALPQEPSPRNLRGQDVDPASLAADEDEEARLPSRTTKPPNLQRRERSRSAVPPSSAR